MSVVNDRVLTSGFLLLAECRAIRFRNVLLSVNAFVSTFVMVVLLALNWEQTYRSSASFIFFDHEQDVFFEGLRLYIFVSTIVLLVQITEYYFTQLRHLTSNFNQMELLEALQGRLIPTFVLEIIVCAFCPIPLVSFLLNSSGLLIWNIFSDKIGLLMFLRFYLVLRILRDYSFMYRKRHDLLLHGRLSKDVATVFGWHLTLRSFVYDNAWVVVIVTAAYLLSIFAFSIWVVERESQPDIFNFFSSLYFTAITMTSVGYGDMVCVTPVGRLLSATAAAAGIMVSSLVVSVVASSINPTEKQQKAIEASKLYKYSISERVAAITLLQTAWRLWYSRSSIRGKMKSDDSHSIYQASTKFERAKLKFQRIRLARMQSRLLSTNPVLESLELLHERVDNLHQQLNPDYRLKYASNSRLRRKR